MAVRVLIVDDSAPFRTFARALLATEGYDVVGEAVDAATAIDTGLEGFIAKDALSGPALAALLG